MILPQTIRIFLIVCSFVFLPMKASSQGGVTFKSGHAIKTGEGGKIYQEKYSDGFANALKRPSTNWFFSTGSMAKREGGYFGEQFFSPGTPLLRWTGLVIGDDYVKKLAEQNGFKNSKSMSKYFVANGNSTFFDRLGISEEQAQVYLLSGLSSKDFEGFEVFGNIEKLVETELEDTIEQLLADEIENAVAEELEEALTQSIEEVIQAMLEDIENYPSGEWFQLSDGSYICFQDYDGQC